VPSASHFILKSTNGIVCSQFALVFNKMYPNLCSNWCLWFLRHLQLLFWDLSFGLLTKWQITLV